MKILLATHNRHKASELKAVLARFDEVSVLTVDDIGYDAAEPVEDGATLEANAYIKARELFEATLIPTIADDTGLEVAALGGAPGVRSARFAGEDATYADNCAALLRALERTERVPRAARFRTVICYVDHLRTMFAEGSVDGTITPSARGEKGFGYDPLFLPDGSDRTFAEMSADEKNGISHRARALERLGHTLVPHLNEWRGCLDG